ncbi:hypothetical protein [Agarivorans albus]|uniref:Uncharacterized protein n=1 Tax=Agarivorans albus MKT 106 TaxID=1331007 RepID=R9PPI4_AGAAL|nr:hypothetical protein [Agarivorans albus]GAD03220.1 hypothetical protein AALB_3300 [Agarivorans albus MKT 106]
MEQSITLNIPQNLTDEQWEKISEVYRSMDGWLEGLNFPYWYGSEGEEKFISVSFEPSGFLFTGNVSHDFWVGWMTQICAKLSLALGQEVYDATM